MNSIFGSFGLLGVDSPNLASPEIEAHNSRTLALRRLDHLIAEATRPDLLWTLDYLVRRAQRRRLI